MNVYPENAQAGKGNEPLVPVVELGQSAIVKQSSSDRASSVDERAASLLATAESIVRWEDDVSLGELRLYERLYESVLERAACELRESSVTDLPLPDSSPDVRKELAELPREQARTALLRLRHQACVRVLRAERARVSARAGRWPWRQYGLVLLGVLAMGLFLSRDALMDFLDIGNVSDGKAWLASSRYAPAMRMSGTLGDFSAPFFFHTAQEREPWIEVDLGANVRVRSITLVNRDDCCAPRAVPLLIETSVDHRNWEPAGVVRKTFGTWRQRLPVNTAHWVRLRVLRETSFHLKALIVRS